MSSLTILLARMRDGDRSAFDQLIPEVYPELQRIAQNQLRLERQSHTLSTVNLVNEAFLRFSSQGKLEFSDRAHFLGVAARIMRNVLVDYARGRHAAKRAGNAAAVPLEEHELTLRAPQSDLVTVLDLDRLLTRLAEEDNGLAQLIEMRFFAGMTGEEIADAVGRSIHSVRHDLRLAQAWLRRAMSVKGDAE